MTCTHQWHDATSSAGPEWVCGKCKVTYTETKKAPQAKRGWVGLTDEEIEQVWRQVQANDFHDCVQPFARAIEAKLRSKHT
jgi:protein-arginine kinase activator protein McsA